MKFEREIGNVYRLKVPFDGDVYTSVFLIRAGKGNVLIDCATTDRDVEEYILPALEKVGLSIRDLSCLVLTHDHGDHAGGLKRILEKFPSLRVVKSASEKIVDGLCVYALKGHTVDSIGVLDIESGTLISGDGLQGDGVGKYRRSIANEEEYLKTLTQLEKDERIENILFSHAYEPWEKCGVFGREEVKKVIKYCKKGAEK